MPSIVKSLKKRRAHRSHGDELNDVPQSLSPTRSPNKKSSCFELMEWKKCIQNADWDSLRLLIKHWQKEIERSSRTEANASSAHRRWALRRYSPRRPVVVFENDDISQSTVPLVDTNGNTRLHIVLEAWDTPNDILLSVIHTDPSCASIPNEMGTIALHLAISRHHSANVIAELLHAFPQGINITDQEQWTPLDYAMDAAKTDSAEQLRHSWISTHDEAVLEWQSQQTRKFAIVRWLLMATASHPQTSLTVGTEQLLLLEAFVHSAPPSVISLLIAASSDLLKSAEQGVAFACAALYLCISRQYPIEILNSLASICPDDVKAVKDETGMGLVAAQYIVGCYEAVGADQWCERQEHVNMMAACVEQGSLSAADPLFIAWWEKLLFLIVYCSRSHEHDLAADTVLHAALSNPDTPPLVIRLLVALAHEIVHTVGPVSKAHPLHLAASTELYVPRIYESLAMKSEAAISIVLEADKRSIRQRHRDMLPLHLAIASGKSWTSLRPLVSADRKTLRDRDPITKLFPFQMAAVMRNQSADDLARIKCAARNEYTHQDWHILSTQQKQRAVDCAIRNEELERLDTIYELLRRYPGAVKSGIPKRRAVKELRDSTGMGMVASHYMIWCYDEATWSVNFQKMQMLQNAIHEASLTGKPVSMTKEFELWWSKMKFWIWYCFRGEIGSKPRDDGTLVMPRTDEYLLHAASSSSDTPPQIVHFLLCLYPHSSRLTLPQSQMLPLHIVASTTAYTQRKFEVQTYNTSLELVLEAYPNAARMKYLGRLPLHHAVEADKTWEEIRPVVDAEPQALHIRDPISGLFPYQLMATRRTYTPEQRLRFQYLARNGVSDDVWQRLSKRERNKEIMRIQREHQLNTLDAIFHLLRRDPSVIQIPTGAKQIALNSKVSEDLAVFTKDVAHDDALDTRSLPIITDDKDKASRRTPSVALSQFLGRAVSYEDNTMELLNTCDASIFSTLDIMSVTSTMPDCANVSEQGRELDLPPSSVSNKAIGHLSRERGQETAHSSPERKSTSNGTCPREVECSLHESVMEEGTKCNSLGQSAFGFLERAKILNPKLQSSVSKDLGILHENQRSHDEIMYVHEGNPIESSGSARAHSSKDTGERCVISPCHASVIDDTSQTTCNSLLESSSALDHQREDPPPQSIASPAVDSSHEGPPSPSDNTKKREAEQTMSSEINAMHGAPIGQLDEGSESPIQSKAFPNVGMLYEGILTSADTVKSQEGERTEISHSRDTSHFAGITNVKLSLDESAMDDQIDFANSSQTVRVFPTKSIVLDRKCEGPPLPGIIPLTIDGHVSRESPTTPVDSMNRLEARTEETSESADTKGGTSHDGEAWPDEEIDFSIMDQNEVQQSMNESQHATRFSGRSEPRSSAGEDQSNSKWRCTDEDGDRASNDAYQGVDVDPKEGISTLGDFLSRSQEKVDNSTGSKGLSITDQAASVAVTRDSDYADDDSTSSSFVYVHRSGWARMPAIMKKRRNDLLRCTNRPAEKSLRCLNCEQGKREVLLLPCRHLTICAPCSVSVSIATCPTCGMKVDDRLVLYL